MLVKNQKMGYSYRLEDRTYFVRTLQSVSKTSNCFYVNLPKGIVKRLKLKPPQRVKIHMEKDENGRDVIVMEAILEKQDKQKAIPLSEVPEMEELVNGN